MNQPAAGQELRGKRSYILDSYEIREHVVTLGRLRMIAEVHGSSCDANTFGLAVEEASGGHACKLVTENGKREAGSGKAEAGKRRSLLGYPFPANRSRLFRSRVSALPASRFPLPPS